MAQARQSEPATRDAEMNGTVQTVTPFQRLVRRMDMSATIDNEQNKFNGDDVNAILAAESEAEMWDADERGPLNFQHLGGCEIQVIDYHVKYSRGESDIVTPFIGEGGKKMYLLVTAVRISDAGEKTLIRLPKVGEVFEANTSARFIVAKLDWLVQHGRIDPDKGKTAECVVQSIDLGGGQAVLKLRPMPERVVRN